MRAIGTRLSVFLAAAAFSFAARAADYPARAVRVIVPFAPGATDIYARFVMDKLQARLGQSFVIETRPGAGTIIGSDAVAKAAPDGYTLLFTSGVLSTLKVLNKQLPFDPDKAFAPVNLVAQNFLVVSISTALPAKNFAEFIDYAKAHPGKLNYVSLGRNSIMLMAESLKHLTGTDIVAVPYQGMAPGRIGLIRNDVQVIIDGAAEQKTMADAGQSRPIMLGGPRRSPALPDVPTAAEVGLPGYQAGAWMGVLAPAGTPRPVVDMLASAVAAAVATPEVQKYFRDQGFEPLGAGPDEFAQRLQVDSRRYADAAKAANVQPE
jgi:tripartite-type tricarboxylate transporter receptor subunit TctC